jgi:dolichyl-phosphate-mannose--protein O-mannosyl transferase
VLAHHRQGDVEVVGPWQVSTCAQECVVLQHVEDARYWYEDIVLAHFNVGLAVAIATIRIVAIAVVVIAVCATAVVVAGTVAEALTTSASIARSISVTIATAIIVFAWSILAWCTVFAWRTIFPWSILPGGAIALLAGFARLSGFTLLAGLAGFTRSFLAG